MSSNAISAYTNDTDDEDEGSWEYNTEEHPIKTEYDEAHELDTMMRVVLKKYMFNLLIWKYKIM